MYTEEWKQVAEGYWVINLGRVYSGARKVRCGPRNGVAHTRTKRGRILGMNISPSGYYRVNIYRQILHVHTLVAKAFLGDPPPNATVNHIDLDKTNNRVDNLEWISSSENAKHAWQCGAHVWVRPVKCIDTGEVFRTSKEAAQARGLYRGNLCTHLKGGQQTFGGHRWEYMDYLTWAKEHMEVQNDTQG